MPVTPEQAILIGRIRDALAALGYTVPAAPKGSPGTLADLAAMAPAMGRFRAILSDEFVARINGTKDPVAKAKLFAQAAESYLARSGPVGAKVAETLGTLATGFMAYRAAKKGADRLATLAGVADSITSAVFGRR